ncbi:MAG: acyl carrier protein [Oscillospiraceae bacterium]|jgi:acyl carrier protein|nr:acyl carrier protein [Oscillospiraceae bacterium]
MIFEKVCGLIAEQFSVDVGTITMETSFAEDLGADSLDIVELSMALEEEFDVGELEDEELTSMLTVGDLVRFLTSRVD